MTHRHAVALLLLLTLALLGGGSLATRARSQEPSLDDLRRRLIEARNEHERDAALDAVQARLASPGRLAEWLGELPDRVRSRSDVMLRRGWAHLAAGDPASARPLLEALLEAGPGNGIVLAYLGEATRLEGDPARALELLGKASGVGYRDEFVVESAQKAAFEMRRDRPSKDVEGIPEYAVALSTLVEHLDHPVLRGVLARWLLEDYATYAVPRRDRAQAWARFAAPHALAATKDAAASGVDARLLLDAAAALENEDRETKGRTLRFDLLAEAYRLGLSPDGHTLPPAIANLAEAALLEGRYELAYRLARERLTISDSPLARRVLEGLPPDVGD